MLVAARRCRSASCGRRRPLNTRRSVRNAAVTLTRYGAGIVRRVNERATHCDQPSLYLGKLPAGCRVRSRGGNDGAREQHGNHNDGKREQHHKRRE
jgi:hypothetical protein